MFDPPRPRVGSELALGIGPVWPTGSNAINTESNAWVTYGASLAIPLAPQLWARVRYDCNTFRRENATRPSGVGIAKWKRDTVTTTNRTGLTNPYGTETALAWDAGGGVKVPITPITALFAEASYDLTFTRDTKTPVVPMRIGVTLGRQMGGPLRRR